MFCTKCSAEIYDGDHFCPRCGAPQKIRSGSAIDEELIKKTASTVDVTPDNPADDNGYIGDHRNNSQHYEQTYSTYYESMERSKRKKKSSCFLKFILTIFFAFLIISVLFCGFLLIRGKNPIDYAKNIFSFAFISKGTVSESDNISESDVLSESDNTSLNDILLSDPSILSTTNSTTMFTTKKTTTSTTTTTTTTKPTTSTTSVGQLVRDTSVGKWTADISALNIEVIGSKVKTINLTIDANGNANVNFKVTFVTVKTTGSFTVENDGKTNLIIKVPYTGEKIRVAGYSKVVNKNQIIFRCSEGDITLNRK